MTQRLALLPRSLKLTLLWLLLPGLIGVLAIDIVSAYQALRSATDRAYDRALLGSVRAIENGVTIERGQVQVNVPYVALSMFESTAQSSVYYRVAFEPAPGKAPEAALTGYDDLPLPTARLENDTEFFYDALYHGEPVRVAAVAKPLYQPGLPARIVIQVAETIETRRALQQAVWRGTLLRDAALVVVSAALLWLGVTVALRPLNRLARSIAVRASDDLRPLDAADVPAEVRPLVQAINHHIQRYAELAEAQSQFLADASHQMRTPLAVLLTQAEYALRETDPARVRESLTAIIARLQSTNRLTSQLLALARARHAGQDAPAEVFDLGELARDVVVDALPLAREKQQDLGWDDAGLAATRRYRSGGSLPRPATSRSRKQTRCAHRAGCPMRRPCRHWHRWSAPRLTSTGWRSNLARRRRWQNAPLRSAPRRSASCPPRWTADQSCPVASGGPAHRPGGTATTLPAHPRQPSTGRPRCPCPTAHVQA